VGDAVAAAGELRDGAGAAPAGVGDSYTLTLVVVAVSGIGVAADHPEAARATRIASRGNHTAMGWFSLMTEPRTKAGPVAPRLTRDRRSG
jgi:hypothetical protein